VNRLTYALGTLDQVAKPRLEMGRIGQRAALTLRTIVYPLGFPLQLCTNSQAVIAVVEESWGRFPKLFNEIPVELRIDVAEDPDADEVGIPSFRAMDQLFVTGSDLKNLVISDLTQGISTGWLTARTVSDKYFFRYYFLDAAALSMIDQLYLTPVHAGFVARNGQGVLLCGDSFSGKSTLAYACARAGWTFICDDGSFLVRRAKDRMCIGNPLVMRLREDGKLLFPELARFTTCTRPNGKRAIEVNTSALPEIHTSFHCEVTHVAFLNRGEAGPARLSRVNTSEAMIRLDCGTAYGPDVFREQRRQTYQRLLTAALWELTYSDLESAVSCLESLCE
jgi:hypothetical protein